MGELNRRENDLISVIVPVYNVEKYLPDCIESILRQTYTKLEIVLVDDGSTDGSAAICDAYAREDSRIKVIHKANGGLSDARNVGIDAATGQYVFLLDSDDYIGNKCIQILYEAIKQSDAQIAICDYTCVKENENGEQPETEYGLSLFDNIECLKQAYVPRMHGIEFIAWGKLYNKRLFQHNGIRYPVGKIHEDMFTTYKLLYYADRTVFVDSVQYYYRQRNGSIMHTAFGEKNLTVLEAEISACDFFREKGEKELYLYAYNSYLRKCCNVLNKILSIENQELSRKWYDIVLRQYRSSLNCRDLAALGLVKGVYYTVIGIKPWKFLLKYVS